MLIEKKETKQNKPIRREKDGWDVLDNMIQSVLRKVMSGRWIATVIICGAFAYLAAKGKIGEEDVVLVVMTVISFYFGLKGRDDDKNRLNKP